MPFILNVKIGDKDVGTQEVTVNDRGIYSQSTDPLNHPDSSYIEANKIAPCGEITAKPDIVGSHHYTITVRDILQESGQFAADTCYTFSSNSSDTMTEFQKAIQLLPQDPDTTASTRNSIANINQETPLPNSTKALTGCNYNSLNNLNTSNNALTNPTQVRILPYPSTYIYDKSCTFVSRNENNSKAEIIINKTISKTGATQVNERIDYDDIQSFKSNSLNRTVTIYLRKPSLDNKKERKIQFDDQEIEQSALAFQIFCGDFLVWWKANTPNAKSAPIVTGASASSSASSTAPIKSSPSASPSRSPVTAASKSLPETNRYPLYTLKVKIDQEAEEIITVGLSEKNITLLCSLAKTQNFKLTDITIANNGHSLKTDGITIEFQAAAEDKQFEFKEFWEALKKAKTEADAASSSNASPTSQSGRSSPTSSSTSAITPTASLSSSKPITPATSSAAAATSSSASDTGATCFPTTLSYINSLQYTFFFFFIVSCAAIGGLMFEEHWPDADSTDNDLIKNISEWHSTFRILLGILSGTLASLAIIATGKLATRGCSCFSYSATNHKMDQESLSNTSTAGKSHAQH